VLVLKAKDLAPPQCVLVGHESSECRRVLVWIDDFVVEPCIEAINEDVDKVGSCHLFLASGAEGGE
jgi:hypothetical protein